MKVYEINLNIDTNICVEKDIKDVMGWIDNAMPGESITITIEEMTESEYAALTEYKGP